MHLLRSYGCCQNGDTFLKTPNDNNNDYFKSGFKSSIYTAFKLVVSYIIIWFLVICRMIISSFSTYRNEDWSIVTEAHIKMGITSVGRISFIVLWPRIATGISITRPAMMRTTISTASTMLLALLKVPWIIIRRIVWGRSIPVSGAWSSRAIHFYNSPK